MNLDVPVKWTALWGYVSALMATNIKSAFANRVSFWMQAGLMAVNNLIFCLTWWIFFQRYREIGGWQLEHMLALYGIVATAFGLVMALAGGVRHMATLIADGDLDTYLAQPKPPVVSAVCHRTIASGWGDIGSGLLLLYLSGYGRLEHLGVIVVTILCGALVFLSTCVIAQSLAFFMGRVQELAHQMMQFTITFSVYPQSVFGGWIKVLLFTVVPAGFIGYLPVELLKEFSTGGLLSLIAATVVYVALALGFFSLGLRRYESGNRIGVRA